MINFKIILCSDHGSQYPIGEIHIKAKNEEAADIIAKGIITGAYLWYRIEKGVE